MKEWDLGRDSERNRERERMREREGWNETEEGEREREREKETGRRWRQREGEIQRQTVMGKEGMCPIVVLKQVCDWDNLHSCPHRKVLDLTQSRHQALNWYMY